MGRAFCPALFCLTLKKKTMANIKLGAIVSDIRGSIGGTTFRRTQNGHIVYNKQQQQFKSASSINSQRIAIGSIFQKWSSLTEIVREQWNYQATLFTFNDKFGDKKKLSGRQLFIKLNSQLLPLGQIITDPSLMDATVEFPIIESLVVSAEDESASIKVSSAIVNSKICVSFYPLRKTKGVKPHAHFKVNAVYNIVGQDIFDIWTAFTNEFPIFSAGMNVGCNIYAVNAYGFKSPVSSIAVTLQ